MAVKQGYMRALSLLLHGPRPLYRLRRRDRINEPLEFGNKFSRVKHGFGDQFANYIESWTHLL